MLARKHLFYTPKLDLDIGQTIAATVGYETYGQLNANRDNAVLICHDLYGTGHAAGRYHADDPEAGWWDPLIGPGKPFDTNEYFVIASDSLCNLHVQNPLVLTTGPASLNPATGEPYGDTFPQVTIRDLVRLQQQLVQSLGITCLAAVAGPGMGGFQALEWAVCHPDMVKKVIAVASAPQSPPLFSLALCQAGIDAVRQDPKGGMVQAATLMAALTRSDAYMTGAWERRTAPGSAHPWADKDGRYLFQVAIGETARKLAASCHADHFVYTARACMLHDIGYGNRGLDVAAQKIRAQVLLLPIVSDVLFPPDSGAEFIDTISQHGGTARLVPVESQGGHSAAIQECGRLAEPIAHFMSRGELH
ncbi:MAG: alpha/beta fold hydrolase [Mycobacterium leprae]